MNELTNEKKMTVKEIAGVLKVSDDTIIRLCKKHYPEIIQNGKTIYLNEIQITTIKKDIGTGRNDLRNVTQVVNINTDKEMEDMTIKVIEYHINKSKELQIENDQLKLTIKEQAPKIEYFEDLCESKDAIDIGTIAKILNVGIGRNQLFEILRNESILMIDNQPYQKYVDCGYFRVIESKYIKPDGSKHIGLKTVVFQSGINYIKTLLKDKLKRLPKDLQVDNDMIEFIKK